MLVVTEKLKDFFFFTGVLVGAPIRAAVTMVALSLKICVRQCNVVKTMQFEPSTPVYDACRIIRERVPEAQSGQGKSYKTCFPPFLYSSTRNTSPSFEVNIKQHLQRCGSVMLSKHLFVCLSITTSQTQQHNQWCDFGDGTIFLFDQWQMGGEFRNLNKNVCCIFVWIVIKCSGCL